MGKHVQLCNVFIKMPYISRRKIFKLKTMRGIPFLLFLVIGLKSIAQTWSGEVANIFYDKCASCHNPNGIAPFSLINYSEVSPMAGAIYDAVNQDRMPPWPPNNNYQSYVHNRALDANQKTTILSWLTAGAPEGNSSATPPPPAFPTNAILGNGDLTLQIPTYMSKAQSGQDDYVCFAIPTGLTQQRMIKSVEIIPGNRSIVHHALIYIDPDGTSPTDTVGGDCASPGSPNATLVTGYTPGSTPMTLPAVDPMKLGIPLPQGSNVVFAMHYPEGSYGEYDSTKVIFHFYPVNETGIRQVFAAPLLANWTFALPPNQTTHVSAQYPNAGGIAVDASMLSVFPHIHLLGESIKSYGLNPTGDTIPLIDIPHWDFHWQDFYFFKNIKRFAQGSSLKAEGTFNNSTTNSHNPNNPPIWVYPGLNTADEMFLVYFHFMAYQAGDENYDMEALMTAGLSEIDLNKDSEIQVYPNPSSGNFQLHFDDKSAGQNLQVRIYDTQGKLVREWLNVPNANDWFWDGHTENGSASKKGVYILSANMNGKFYTTRLIRF